MGRESRRNLQENRGVSVELQANLKENRRSFHSIICIGKTKKKKKKEQKRIKSIHILNEKGRSSIWYISARLGNIKQFLLVSEIWLKAHNLSAGGAWAFWKVTVFTVTALLLCHTLTCRSLLRNNACALKLFTLTCTCRSMSTSGPSQSESHARN